MNPEDYGLSYSTELICEIPNEIHVVVGNGGMLSYGKRFLPHEHEESE